MKFLLLHCFLLLATCAAPLLARADVQPNSLFSDNSVLQRDKPVSIWGTAENGERVTVSFAGQTVSTVAQNGNWTVKLAPMKANTTPATLTISGRNTVILRNIVVGDVWICSGQSNMERQLGPRPPQQDIENWKQEAASANFPLIREYYVPEVLSLTAKEDVGSRWRVCSPGSAPDFSAVGFFFARAMHQELNVPIGMIFSAWGGTPAQSWTSASSLKTMPDFAPTVAQLEASQTKGDDYAKTLADYFAKIDPGSAPGAGYAALDFPATGWKPLEPHGPFEAAGATGFDGLVWLRREVQLPPGWAGKEAVLHLGNVDDNDTTFVNGVQIGATEGWNAGRDYKIPANLLRAGRNVIAVRLVDTGGGGGFTGDAKAQMLESAGQTAIPLAGNWTFQTGAPLSQLNAMPRRVNVGPGTPTVLYNGMIAPFTSAAIKGVIWYQGESNNDNPKQYQTLFPLLISDWRRSFGQGDFPFLWVQIAPYNGMSPEIREAQLLTLRRAPNTAMVVTTDVGDANDIHPTRKAPVGERLALGARALSYGEKIEFSGPLYQSFKIEGNRAIVSFSHVGGGLVAKDGALKGFTIAGADGKFVPASAQIVGETVVVSSDQVAAPTAVRFGWANVPDVNLFNAQDLPASPFRTDDGSQTTKP